MFITYIIAGLNPRLILISKNLLFKLLYFKPCLMSLQPKRYFTAFLVSCLMIISVSACAQEMDRPVVDQFTNDTTLSTTQENVAEGSDEYLEAYYSRIKNAYYLNFRVDILCENHHSFSVAKGNDAIIKLQNGKFMNTVI